MTDEELIERARRVSTNDVVANPRGHRALIADLADALEAATTAEKQMTDREILVQALVDDAWEGHDEPLSRVELDLIAGTVIDAGFMRVPKPVGGDDE